MPLTVRSIDKIARDENKGVLYIYFDKDIFPNWKKNTKREEVIQYLKINTIPYEPCMRIPPKSGAFSGYRGDIYIDLPMDEENYKFKLLNNYLENKDGKPNFKGVHFYYLALDEAMKYIDYGEAEF